MEQKDVDFEIAKQCWSASNIVVGFGAAQLIAFALTAAGATKDAREHTGLDFEIQQHFNVSLGAAVASTIVYIMIVLFCQRSGDNILLNLPHSPRTRATMRVFGKLRIFAVFVGGMVSFLLILSIKYPDWGNMLSRISR